MRPPITSEKHYVQTTPTTVAVGTVSFLSIVSAVHVQDKRASSGNEVTEGSVVKAIYVEIWLSSAEPADGASSFVATISKLSGADTGATFSEMIGLQQYDNKKNVFYTTQGLVSGDQANAVPIIRGWFKMPKGKQRMGFKDRIFVSIAGLAGDVEYCGFSTFKEYN